MSLDWIDFLSEENHINLIKPKRLQTQTIQISSRTSFHVRNKSFFAFSILLSSLDTFKNSRLQRWAVAGAGANWASSCLNFSINRSTWDARGEGGGEDARTFHLLLLPFRLCSRRMLKLDRQREGKEGGKISFILKHTDTGASYCQADKRWNLSFSHR